MSPAPTRRRSRTTLLLIVAVLASMIVMPGAFANHSLTPLHPAFESRDGNMIAQPGEGHPGSIDWNSFLVSTVADDWQYTKEGDEKVSVNNQLRDDQFSGGTKQDDDCATVTLGSFGGPDGSKVDLDYIYLAQKELPVTVGSETVDHQFLFLAWTRVRQNSTTNSSHVGYEFNKGTDGLCANGQTYKRVAGDMLVVYDFPGGDSDQVNLKLSRWLTSAAGDDVSQCEVAKALPCWGNTTLLTGSQADGRVNTTSVGAIQDQISTPGSPITRGVVEFGEAAIDLTAAGVFEPGVCEGFGYATGVSRSSGSSGSAAMKDVVGPVNFDFGNCTGAIQVEKRISSNTGSLLTGATFTITPGDIVMQETSTPGVYCTEGLLYGDYTVTETTAPDGYTGVTQPVNVTVDSQATCPKAASNAIFVNNPAPGRINITKTDDQSPAQALNGAVFTLTNKQGTPAYSETCTTGVANSDGSVPAAGVCSFIDVPLGEYTLDETTVPAGYSKAAGLPTDVTVALGSSPGSGQTQDLGPYVDPRLHKVITFVCHEGSNSLYSSSVELDGVTKNSAAAVPAALAAKGVTAAELCGITDGASFGGLGHDTFDGEVTIAGH